MMGYDGSVFLCQLVTPKLPTGKNVLGKKKQMPHLKTQQLHFFPSSCGSCWCVGPVAQTLLGEPFPFAGLSFFQSILNCCPFSRLLVLLFCKALCAHFCATCLCPCLCLWPVWPVGQVAKAFCSPQWPRWQHLPGQAPGLVPPPA